MWKVINRLSAEARPAYYKQRQFYRLSHWGAVKCLLKVKLLHRHRGLISRQSIAYRPKPRVKVTRLKPCIEIGHSNGDLERANSPSTQPHPDEFHVDKLNKPRPAEGGKTESARPPATSVAAAAGLIAMLPRRPRHKWTGKFGGEWVRRYSPFRVPDGDVRPLLNIREGKVCVIAPEGSGRSIDVYRSDEVQRVKNPAAVLMGRLHKGVRERPSASKAASARANGVRPCGPGKRRGRPKKVVSGPQ